MANPDRSLNAAMPVEDRLRVNAVSKPFTNTAWPDEIDELLDQQSVVAVFALEYTTPINWQKQTDKHRAAWQAFKQARMVRFNQKTAKTRYVEPDKLVNQSPAYFFEENKPEGLKIWYELLDKGHVHFQTVNYINKQALLIRDDSKQTTNTSTSSNGAIEQEEVYLEGEIYCIHNKQKEITGHVGFFVDLTACKKNEKEAIEKRDMYQILADYSTDVVWIYNLQQHRFGFVSPAVLGVLGYTVEEALAMSADQLIVSPDYERVRSEINIREALFQGLSNNPEHAPAAEPSIELQVISKHGNLVWCELKGRFRHNEQGELELIGSIRNIEARKKSEERITYLSFHDQLTTLYNRHFYVTELRRLDVDRNLPMSVIVADVNGLKATNDIYGHTAGDRLLIAVAEVLQDVCRSDEIIARVGGDEFVVLLPKTTREQCEFITKRINDEIDNMVLPESVLSVSFGLATKEYPHQPFSETFKNAEDEMYKNKVVDRSLFEKSLFHHIETSLYGSDPVEAKHSKRVAALSRKWAEYLNFNAQEVDKMEKAGRYHDIGKVVVDQPLLTKTPPLNGDDWRQLRRHAEIGFIILNYLKDYRDIAEIVLAHHERCDGLGYPKKLKGEDIPAQACMLSIMDAYDTMLKIKKMSHDKVIAELKENSGTQFDCELVKSFLDMLQVS